MPKRRASRSLPSMLIGLGVASAQTIALRSAMMARGTCSPAEYRRMVREKMAAAQQTTRLLGGWPPASAVTLLAPWHQKARANAKRLKRRG